MPSPKLEFADVLRCHGEAFRRIRYFGLFANGHRAAKLERCRQLLDVAAQDENEQDARTFRSDDRPTACPCCGGPMRIFEAFGPRYGSPPSSRHPRGFDSS